MTARSWWPKTLCRPPAIGSSAAPTRPSSTSSSACRSRAPAPRGPGRRRRTGSAAAPGRWAAARPRPRRSPRGPRTRSCRSRGPRPAGTWRPGRGGGCRPGRRTARAPLPVSGLPGRPDQPHPGRPPGAGRRARATALRNRWSSSSSGDSRHAVTRRAQQQPERLVRDELGHVHLRLLQPPGVVPVHRLPAGELVEHPDARLPRPVARLAVAAERQVRLGAGGGVVDADHAGRDAAAERERLRRVAGVDRRRKPVTGHVGQPDRLVEVAVGRDADERAERLVAEDRIVLAHTVDDRRVVEDAGVRVADEALARVGRRDPAGRGRAEHPVVRLDPAEVSPRTARRTSRPASARRPRRRTGRRRQPAGSPCRTAR